PHNPRAGCAGYSGIDFWLAHSHPRMPDAKVTQQRDLERRPGGDAVQGCDDGLGEGADPVVQVLPLLYPYLAAVAVELTALFQVLTGSESPIACTRQDHGANGRVALQVVQLRDELLAHETMPGVED